MPLVNKTFDQLLDFTRTSAATFVGSNGLIQNTAASRNLLTQTQQFDNAFWTKTAATVTANTTVAPDGTSTADTLTEDTTAASAHRVFTTVTVAAAAHTASVYVKAGTRSWFYIRLTDSGAVQRYAYFNVGAGTLGTVETNLTASITPAGDGWYRCSATVNVAATSLPVIFAITTGDNTQIHNGNGTGSLFYWGAQLEAASAPTTYTRNNGGVYPPRFGYDPVTLAPKGLLVEEQRANLLTYSEQFDNASWVKNNSTVTANATTSPDGTVDADKLVENTANSQHRTSQFVSKAAAATTYTFTFYAKAAERNFVWVYFEDGSGNGMLTDFNLSTGTVSTAASLVGTGFSGQSSSITAAGNGWYRCVATVTTNSAIEIWGRIGTATAAGTYTYAGTAGSGIFIYGAQLEAGAFATSYIPTVASQVTRTADRCDIVAPNFAPWYNQSQGTFVAEFSGNGSYAVVATDGTTNNYNGITYNSPTSVRGVTVAAGVFAGVTMTGGAAGTVTKTAYGYKVNDLAGSTNGGAVVANATAAIPTLNQLLIGTYGGFGQLNGHIRSIRYYPTRLTNAQLQALTA